jgi:hypothetical protein
VAKTIAFLHEREDFGDLKTAALYFKGQVPLADILMRIQKNMDRL